MITQRDIVITTDIIRSFNGQQFTMEEFKTLMARYPPRVRVPARTIANILKQNRLARVVGRSGVGELGATTVWRPL